MAWKELAAQVDTRPIVGALRSIEGKVSKRQFKRLLATAVAQLLELHPRLGRGKARRWARRATGERPLKKALKAAGKAADDLDVKEALAASGAAAAGAGVAKVVRSLARPLKKRASGAASRLKEAGSDVVHPAT